MKETKIMVWVLVFLFVSIVVIGIIRVVKYPCECSNKSNIENVK